MTPEQSKKLVEIFGIYQDLTSDNYVSDERRVRCYKLFRELLAEADHNPFTDHWAV